MAIGKQADQGRSPYKKKNKKPFQYSETYRRWKSAIMAGHDNAARELAAEHHRKFVGNQNFERAANLQRGAE
ncbi:hypothetical protein [Bradyrhizobium sp. Ai1a-2]|uniref:hypothetical protein n=1 Tax=Bradyrhizobium sp. Ai1a-2 TaxID=196490 RepID=UPI000405F235|nr:hypothetical protein [Bradyrhizobium sp. Ai1a-2]